MLAATLPPRSSPPVTRPGVSYSRLATAALASGYAVDPESYDVSAVLEPTGPVWKPYPRSFLFEGASRCELCGPSTGEIADGTLDGEHLCCSCAEALEADWEPRHVTLARTIVLPALRHAAALLESREESDEPEAVDVGDPDECGCCDGEGERSGVTCPACRGSGLSSSGAAKLWRPS